jgi:hypothetical protein
MAVLTMAVDEAGDFGYRWLLEAMYAALVDLVDGLPSRAQRCSRRLAAGLDGGRSVPGAAAFVDRAEAEVTARLAAAPERMLIPLGKMLLIRERGWADLSVESLGRSQLCKDL